MDMVAMGVFDKEKQSSKNTAILQLNDYYFFYFLGRCSKTERMKMDVGSAKAIRKNQGQITIGYPQLAEYCK